MSEDKDFLGKEPIGKLLLKLALPTVTAQIINMLYNIVTAIFFAFQFKKALKQISGKESESHTK